MSAYLRGIVVGHTEENRVIVKVGGITWDLSPKEAIEQASTIARGAARKLRIHPRQEDQIAALIRQHARECKGSLNVA